MHKTYAEEQWLFFIRVKTFWNSLMFKSKRLVTSSPVKWNFMQLLRYCGGISIGINIFDNKQKKQDSIIN